MQSHLRSILLLALVCVYVLSQSVEYVPYTDNGFAIAGYRILPSGTGPFPAVIIIHDADGVGQYEVKRAKLLADQGYIGFAADIFGENIRDPPPAQRTTLISMYRGNTTLFNSRMQAAVNVIRQHPLVIQSKIAMIGYCFGGTGVINYALSGGNVAGIVSFHGGLTQRVTARSTVPILAKMLLYSGGNDDPSTEIKRFEAEVSPLSATWEITRFSQTNHAFTIWSDTRYSPRADQRSWEGTLLFLIEIFSPTNPEVIPATALASGIPPSANSVDYTDNGFALTGYEVLPNNLNTLLPAVIVLPDWDGVNSYEIERARLTATHVDPYVTFAADIYGSDKHNVVSTTERTNLANLYRNNVTLYNGRIRAAINALKSRPRVDPTKIVVIGYCFGGTGVFNYAISGASDIVGVVSFHGGLTTRLTANPAIPIPASVLVHSGGNDDTSSNIEKLEMELNSANGMWEISRYSKVVHGFTDWNAGSAYSARADLRSRKSMITFLSALFSGGVYSGSVQPPDMVIPTASSSTSSSTPTTSSAATTDVSTTATPSTSTTSSTTSTSSTSSTSTIATTATAASTTEQSTTTSTTTGASTTGTPTTAAISTTGLASTAAVTTGNPSATTASQTSSSTTSTVSNQQTTASSNTSIPIIVGVVVGVIAIIAVVTVIICIAKSKGQAETI